MSPKLCSTGAMDAFFAYLYTPNANLRLVVMSTSDAFATITGASSNSTGCIAQSTLPAFPTSDHIASLIASSGNNRYMTIGACSCDTVINTNIAGCVALIDDSSSVRYITTCTTQTLTAGNKVNIGTWTITINQPT